MRSPALLTLVTVCTVVAGSLALLARTAEAQTRPTLYWGSSGQHVRDLQWRLNAWGYYHGPIDGYFGAATSQAVKLFQRRNGLVADGIVGPQTWAALGLGGGVQQAYQSTTPTARSGSVDLLARLVTAEALGEPYAGMVAVAAVVLNRVADPRFPNSISGVIFQPRAFESVSNGLIWRRTPSSTSIQAANDALNGWDPSWGSLYFWNPSKPVSPWIWTRNIIVRIGRHVFGI